ncbi:chitin deacetylase, partial [Entophlyctis luteolus]
LGDNVLYPWINVPVSSPDHDGESTPGGPNGAGVPWGSAENKATEVFQCLDGHFDDGPGLTPSFLNVLNDNAVVGTFFLIGANIVNDPTHVQYVKDLYDAGHQIALHTCLQSNEELISEIIFNILSIYNIIGKVPRYFRPPYGAIDDRSRHLLYAMGLRPVMWTIDTADTAATNNSTVSAAVITAEKYVEQNYDPAFNYFPSNTRTPDGNGYTYEGHITLEHESTDSELQVATQFVPFMATRGKKSVFVNECDQVLPNGSFYLPENAVLVQFVKSITLPLTEADYNASNVVFATKYTNGAAAGTLAVEVLTTTTAAVANTSSIPAKSPTYLGRARKTVATSIAQLLLLGAAAAVFS